MSADGSIEGKIIELEERLLLVQNQLASKTGEIAVLQRAFQADERRRRSVRSPGRFTLIGCLSVGLVGIGLMLSPQSRAQNPTINTVLKAPILVQNAAGQTILEISDRPRHHGITLYNKAGTEVAYLGVTTDDIGIFGLEGADGKLLADVSQDGFKFFGKSTGSVAFMGADNGGNGAIQLKNSADGVVVDAGVLGAATGYVQVYPRSGKTPFPIPNYIKGGK